MDKVQKLSNSNFLFVSLYLYNNSMSEYNIFIV
jgi:hypothetical protein